MKYKVGDKIKLALHAPQITNVGLIKLYESNGGWLQIRLVSDHGYRYVGDEGMPESLHDFETFYTDEDSWTLVGYVKPKPFKLR